MFRLFYSALCRYHSLQRATSAFTLVSALVLLLSSTFVYADEGTWKQTIERVSQSILSIEIDLNKPFNENMNSSQIATGFIVDAERGLVLTNRHVIMAGPITAFATFTNGERIKLNPLYRDPVHDFAFFKYDPALLRYNTPASLPLVANGAKEGLEIRVIGNDAGERNAILPGIIARLDRNAPSYGRGRFNDFNTFYYQSGSMTSGGSSGSPVINEKGEVVALNAGGSSKAASAYFLPLDSIIRAFKALQQDQPVPRGTLETLFRHRSYDKLLRLGLPTEIESEVRATYPHASGMLLVADVIPESPTEPFLQSGDILYKINGQLLSGFTLLSQVLDESVGKSVSVSYIREGKVESADIEVRSLSRYDQDRFLEIGGAVFHKPPYYYSWFTRNRGKGVFVAASGYLFRGYRLAKGDVITGINGKSVEDTSDLLATLKELPQGAEAQVSFISISKPTVPDTSLMSMHSNWFLNRECTRTGRPEVWQCDPLELNSAAEATPPVSVTLPTHEIPAVQKVSSSLAYLKFKAPYSIAGYKNSQTVSYEGTGLIIDAEQGLIVTDRNLVIHSLGELTLTIAGTAEIPGRVVSLHPTHNLALIQYDPSQLKGDRVTSIPFTDRLPKDGEEVYIAGIDEYGAPKVARARVSEVQPSGYQIPEGSFFHESMMEAIQLEDHYGDLTGALISDSGEVFGLWASFGYLSRGRLNQSFAGIPSTHISYLKSLYLDSKEHRVLPASLEVTPLTDAVRLGLPREQATELAKNAFRGRRQVLRVAHLDAGQEESTPLKPNDLVLEIDGAVATSFLELERLSQKPTVVMKVWRNGKAMTLTVNTRSVTGNEVSRVLLWEGAVLHDPHYELEHLKVIPPRGVYVNYRYYGSPASKGGLRGQILSMNGLPTPNLKTFVEVLPEAKKLSADGNGVVVLRIVDSNGREGQVAIEPRTELWPTQELKYDGTSWSVDTLYTG